MHDRKNADLRALPSVDELLRENRVAPLIEDLGRPATKDAVRRALRDVRRQYEREGTLQTNIDSLFERIEKHARLLAGRSLRPVINGSGILLHTNLSRAPLGAAVIAEISETLKGYTNLEFDLESARRGHRTDHVRDLLRFLTGTEDVVVVNNNAAAIVLALSTFAKNKEVIVSRGELIEIGGSFRIPDIMAAAGATMVEVGTTNRTRLSDYESAIGPNTALIFKAHKSNYAITGFTEEVGIKALSGLAHDRGLMLLYDIGSGLLRRPDTLDLKNEPDVSSALSDGADLVSFSGDKLLGGPQSGIIAGLADPISMLSKAPMMRALRVGKLTYVALCAACRQYLTDERLLAHNPTFSMMERSAEARKALANLLSKRLATFEIASRVVPGVGRCGGGTLPELTIPSHSVEILPRSDIGNRHRSFSERVFHNLLRAGRPVLGILKEGKLLIDVFALDEAEIEDTAELIREAVLQENPR